MTMSVEDNLLLSDARTQTGGNSNSAASAHISFLGPLLPKAGPTSPALLSALSILFSLRATLFLALRLPPEWNLAENEIRGD
jgi:hypothetical protein